MMITLQMLQDRDLTMTSLFDPNFSCSYHKTKVHRTRKSEKWSEKKRNANIYSDLHEFFPFPIHLSLEYQKNVYIYTLRFSRYTCINTSEYQSKHININEPKSCRWNVCFNLPPHADWKGKPQRWKEAKGKQEKGIWKILKLWWCTRGQNKRQNGTLVHIENGCFGERLCQKLWTVLGISNKMLFAFTPKQFLPYIALKAIVSHTF